MREILFRGKRIDNDEWVYGSLSMEYFAECGCVMVSPTSDTCYKVIPDTVGQYTGLTDKNGKKIFEGDIVRYFQNLLGGVVYEHKDPVLFLEGGFTVGVYFLAHWLRDVASANIQLDGIEVIGNIHDNPEILED